MIYTFVHAESSEAAARWFKGLEAAIFSLNRLPNRGILIKEAPHLRHLLYSRTPHVDRIIFSVDEKQQPARESLAPHRVPAGSLVESSRCCQYPRTEKVPTPSPLPPYLPHLAPETGSSPVHAAACRGRSSARSSCTAPHASRARGSAPLRRPGSAPPGES